MSPPEGYGDPGGEFQQDLLWALDPEDEEGSSTSSGKARFVEDIQEILRSEIELMQQRLMARLSGHAGIQVMSPQLSADLVDRPNRVHNTLLDVPHHIQSTEDFGRRESSVSKMHSSPANVALENWRGMLSNILGVSGTGVMQEAGRAFVDNIGLGRRGHLDALGELDDLCSPHPEWLNQKVSLTSNAPSSSFAASHVQMVSKNARTSTRTTALDQTWTSEASFLGRMVIDPEGNKRLLWTSFGALLLLYDTLTIPLEAIDLWDPPIQAVFTIIAYWFLDLITSFLTGYTIDNRVEMRPDKTARQYATTWLPIDVVVLFIDVGFAFIRFNAVARGGRMVRLLRVFRLVRLVRLRKWVLAVKTAMRSNTSEWLDIVGKIGSIMFMLLIMCHWIACVWISMEELSAGAKSWGIAGSWLDEFEGADSSALHRYSMAFHWSITQFTPATNNIVPVSTIERIFACMVVMMGMVVFSAFLSSVTASVNQLKSLNAARYQDRHNLVNFIKGKRIPSALADRILSVLDMEDSKSKNVLIESDVPLLKRLPESMRIRMHRECYLHLVQANAILDEFRHTDPRCFLQICHEAMTDNRYNFQEEIFMDGKETSTAYVVVSGSLKYQVRAMDEDKGFHRRATHWMEPESWLSEAAIWVHWTHQGSLVAHSCANLVQVDCSMVRTIVRASGGALAASLRCVAVLFAYHLEKMLAQTHPNLTDLSFHKYDLKDMAWRASRFCKTNEPSSTTPRINTINNLGRMNSSESTSDSSHGASPMNSVALTSLRTTMTMTVDTPRGGRSVLPPSFRG